jgi:hypothetical protein
VKLQAFITYNAVYLAVALPAAMVIFAIFYWGLKYKRWQLPDFGILFMGSIYWLAWYVSKVLPIPAQGKTLANLVELIMLAVICCGVLAVRAVVSRGRPEHSLKIGVDFCFCDGVSFICGILPNTGPA